MTWYDSLCDMSLLTLYCIVSQTHMYLEIVSVLMDAVLASCALTIPWQGRENQLPKVPKLYPFTKRSFLVNANL